MNDYPVTLRLAFQGYSASRIGLNSVFLLPDYLGYTPRAPALRLALHQDATLSLQSPSCMGRWVDVWRLLPLELVVE